MKHKNYTKVIRYMEYSKILLCELVLLVNHSVQEESQMCFLGPKTKPEEGSIH